MSKINYQELREAAERAIPEMELLTLPFDAWLSKQELKDYGVDIDVINTFRLLAGPETMLELLDEIKRQEDTNIDATCRISELETILATLVAENAGLRHVMTTSIEHENVEIEQTAGCPRFKLK
ncbi:ead/Ea22-like family protein, partial [Escherichia coli]